VPTVLIVEDDGVIARSISMHLRHAGFDVEWADSGDRGLKKLRFERPDVVLVDLMLPGLDGWAFTETARREGISAPIVVISARASEHDKVHALEIGADDYLAKPFGMRELVARVQVALRRSRIEPMPAREAIQAPGLVIDPDQQRAFLTADEGRVDAELTPTEFRLLWVLAQNSGRVMSRDELQQRVWGVPHRPRDRSVDVCVRKLREKLDRRSTHSYLQTQYGVGYRFDPVPAGEAPEADQPAVGRRAAAGLPAGGSSPASR
jgi:DNA-binding response OmpR family regulator